MRLLGEAASVKPCCTFTLSASVVLAERLPDVPLMVSVAVPVGAALDAASVRVLAPVVELGLNDAVTPLGRPDTESATLPLNPP